MVVSKHQDKPKRKGNLITFVGLENWPSQQNEF